MTVEDRVTAALQALAGGAQAPLDGEHRLTARLRREHRNRRLLAAVGTAAAVFAVVGVVSVAGSSGSVAPAPLATHGPPSVAPSPEPSPEPTEASPSPAPTYPPPAAGVGGPRWFLALEPAGKWAFHDARTGESSAAVNPSGYTVTAVAAGGDDRKYFTAATKGKCGTVLFHRVEVRNGDVHSISNHDVPGTRGVRGEVLSMALSPDGTRLAYSIATTTDPVYKNACSAYEVRVLNLRTGASRAWTGEDATPTDLAWAPDNRTILLHVAFCCGDYNPALSRLDTQSSRRSFLDAPVTPGTDSFHGCGVTVSTSSGGAVYAAQECYEQHEVRVVELDPVTGRVLRRIAIIRGVELVRSLSVTDGGAHVLLSATGDGDLGNYRIDGGVVSRLPTHLDQIAW